MAAYRESDWLELALHRIWVPGGTPIDLEETIETYLLHLQTAYHVQQVLCDPFQMRRSIVTLQAAQLPILESPQSVGNTVRMGQKEAPWVPLLPQPELDYWVEWVTATFKLARAE